jgi:hypothetical protein
VLALADARHAVVTEAPQRAQHRLPLGVGDLRLEDHVDDHPGHADEGTGRRRASSRPVRDRSRVTESCELVVISR